MCKEIIRMLNRYYVEFIFLFLFIPLFCMQRPIENENKSFLEEQKTFSPSKNRCRFCYGEYASSQAKTKHERACIERKGLWCRGCGISFIDQTTQVDHQEKCSRFQDLKCSICGKVFSSKYCKNKHTQTCQSSLSSEYAFKCHFCKRDFSSTFNKEAHERTCPERTGLWCIGCNEIFQNLDDLSSHQNECPLFQNFKCEYCHAVFSYQASKKDHIRICLERKGFWCRGCNEDFQNLNDLSSHQNECPLFQNLKCKYCFKIFSYLSTRKKHEKNCRERKTFWCKGCNEQFQNLNNLSRHQNKCPRFLELKYKTCQLVDHQKKLLGVSFHQFSKNTYQQTDKNIRENSPPKLPLQKSSQPFYLQEIDEQNEAEVQPFSGHKRIRPQGYNDDHENQFNKKRRRKNIDSQIIDTYESPFFMVGVECTEFDEDLRTAIDLLEVKKNLLQ